VLRDTCHTTPERLEEIERFLSAVTLHVYPTDGIDADTADRDDNRVLECAVKSGSRVIVSGDQDLL
jgi:predicted nucleic acid-binding protein